MTRVVGIGGYARSGKDTAAQTLVAAGWRRLAFADALKELAVRVGWDGSKDECGRQFLEELGDTVRETLHPLALVWPVQDAIQQAPADSFVITDMRRVEEAEMVRHLGGLTVQVVRPGCRPGGPSDTQLRGHRFDHVVANSGTVEELHGRVRAAVGLE